MERSVRLHLPLRPARSATGPARSDRISHQTQRRKNCVNQPAIGTHRNTGCHKRGTTETQAYNPEGQSARLRPGPPRRLPRYFRSRVEIPWRGEEDIRSFVLEEISPCQSFPHQLAPQACLWRTGKEAAVDLPPLLCLRHNFYRPPNPSFTRSGRAKPYHSQQP